MPPAAVSAPAMPLVAASRQKLVSPFRDDPRCASAASGAEAPRILATARQAGSAAPPREPGSKKQSAKHACVCCRGPDTCKPPSPVWLWPLCRKSCAPDAHLGSCHPGADLAGHDASGPLRPRLSLWLAALRVARLSRLL